MSSGRVWAVSRNPKVLPTLSAQQFDPWIAPSKCITYKKSALYPTEIDFRQVDADALAPVHALHRSPLVQQQRMTARAPAGIPPSCGTPALRSMGLVSVSDFQGRGGLGGGGGPPRSFLFPERSERMDRHTTRYSFVGSGCLVPIWILASGVCGWDEM